MRDGRSSGMFIGGGCDMDWNDAKGFHPRLATIVEERFLHNPCLEFRDLFIPTFDILQRSRHNCECDDRCLRQIQLTYVRDFVEDLVRGLGSLDREMLARFLRRTPKSLDRIIDGKCAVSYPIVCCSAVNQPVYSITAKALVVPGSSHRFSRLNNPCQM